MSREHPWHQAYKACMDRALTMAVIQDLLASGRCNGSPSLRGHLERELAQIEAEQIQLEGAYVGYGS